MFLTDVQKRTIVKNLGYPFSYISRFNVLSTDIPTDVIEEIDNLLANIVRVSEGVTSSFSNLAIKKVDEIEFFPQKDTNVISAQYEEKDKFIDELADLLGIPLAYGYRHDTRHQ